MILKSKIGRTFKIYSAVDFQRVFKIEEARDEDECDEDYIMRKLESMDGTYDIIFIESNRGNCYDEYWLIKEILQ
jgi:hypothetical protein